MKEDLSKQLKTTRHAIDLIKISQRSQHTSIKEALTKILRCIEMMAGADEKDHEKADLLEKTQKIAASRKEKQDEPRGI